MKMWMIPFYLMLKNSSTVLQQLVFRTGLILNVKVYCFFEFIRLFELNDFVLSFESGLKKIESLLNGFVDELSVELGMRLVSFHFSLMKYNTVYNDDNNDHLRLVAKRLVQLLFFFIKIDESTFLGFISYQLHSSISLSYKTVITLRIWQLSGSIPLYFSFILVPSTYPM